MKKNGNAKNNDQKFRTINLDPYFIFYTKFLTEAGVIFNSSNYTNTIIN